MSGVRVRCFCFFNDTATTEIYTLSLHDALPISWLDSGSCRPRQSCCGQTWIGTDRKSTRLNSSHLGISYAVFCLKKKIVFRRSFHVSACKAIEQQLKVRADHPPVPLFAMPLQLLLILFFKDRATPKTPLFPLTAFLRI